MKTPFLLLTATVLALTAAAAVAGVREDLHRLKNRATHTDRSEPGEDHHVRDGLRSAWEQLKEAGREARDGVADSVDKIKAATSDIRHERPFLLSEYVTAVKKGKEVTLIHCESRIKRVAKAQRCEKLHNGTFKIDELKSCLTKVEGDKQPGMILNRNLTTVAESDYGHDHFKMYDSKDAYRDYLAQCQVALKKKPSRSIAARAVPVPVAETKANPEFKPIPLIDEANRPQVDAGETF